MTKMMMIFHGSIFYGDDDDEEGVEEETEEAEGYPKIVTTIRMVVTPTINHLAADAQL